MVTPAVGTEKIDLFQPSQKSDFERILSHFGQGKPSKAEQV